MNLRITAAQAMVWTLWAACALALLGAVIALALPPRDENRIAPMALPFAVGAAALAANALTQRRNPWLTGLLYALAGLAITYGIMLGLAVPLSMTVEGACQPAPAPCPLGYARPLTNGESLGLELAAIGGALALALSFVAVELHYRPRIRLFPAPPLSSPAPPPPGPGDPTTKSDS